MNHEGDPNNMIKPAYYLLGVFVCCLATTSCSSTPQKWYKAGGTTAMYERDSTECDNKLIDTPGTAIKVDSYTWESCMEAKGWVALDSPAM